MRISRIVNHLIFTTQDLQVFTPPRVQRHILKIFQKLINASNEVHRDLKKTLQPLPPVSTDMLIEVLHNISLCICKIHNKLKSCRRFEFKTNSVLLQSTRFSFIPFSYIDQHGEKDQRWVENFILSNSTVWNVFGEQEFVHVWTLKSRCP